MTIRIVSTVMVVGLATAAHAQLGNVTIGSEARAFAMGGAGVATGGANRANPASLAFAKKLSVSLPTLGLRTSGGINEVTKLSNVSKFIRGTESEKQEAATEMARQFASQDSQFGLNAGFGLRMGPLELQTNGVTQGKLIPGESLKRWAQGGGSGDAPAGASSEISAAALYTLPSIGVGIQLPLRKLSAGGQKTDLALAIGGRVKYLNSVYSRYIATSDGSGSFNATPAPELGGRDYLSQKGIAADLGLMGQWSQAGASLAGGLVVTNAVKPRLTFKDASGTLFDPVVQTVSAGASFHKGGLTIAGDLVDLTGKQQLRFGGEQKLGPLALRAGYSSRGGATYGLGILGIDIAFGKGQPLEVVQTIRF
ncbi:hypothetical protein [Armatimonas sp.]|uniref:hypothetical protein n=1 Tax=Armatimonas sp. TaxID=1872638 RepID=UPI00286A0942|nr:hypothetical protein [Armatimonas sp.]